MNQKNSKKATPGYVMYQEVVLDQYQIILDLKKKADSILSQKGDRYSQYSKFYKIETKMVKASAIVVLFSAFYLDAYIYDFARDHFSKTYIKKYLDKLNLDAKWIIVPKLVTGKDYPTDSQAYQDLLTVVKLRNDLAHPKPISMIYFPSNEEEKKQSQKSMEAKRKTRMILLDNSYIALRACRDVVIELFRIAREPWDFEESKAMYSRIFEKFIPLPKINIEIIAEHHRKFLSKKSPKDESNDRKGKSSQQT